MSDTPETDNQSFVAEHNLGKELCVEAWFCEIMERERDAWKLNSQSNRDEYHRLMIEVDDQNFLIKNIIKLLEIPENLSKAEHGAKIHRTIKELLEIKKYCKVP